MNVIQFALKVCERNRNQLDALLSQELPDEARLEVQQQLENCAACQAELATRARIRQRLKEAVTKEFAPPELADRIRCEMRASSGFPHWLIAAAAILTLTFGGWFTFAWLKPGTAETIAAQPLTPQSEQILRIGYGDHQHCVFDRGFKDRIFTAEEISARMGDQLGLVAVTQREVPQEFQITVAHQCHFQGRQFIHLTLKNSSGSLLSVILTRKQAGESLVQEPASAAPVTLHHARLANFEVSGFESHDYLAFVVSDLPRAQNLLIAARLAPAVNRYLADTKIG